MVENKKFILIFFLVLIAFKPVWLFNNPDLGSPGNDDLSYWLHTATIVYDFDFDYQNDYKVSRGTYNYQTNTPYHPPGAGYLSSVFVFIFTLFDNFIPNRLNPVGSYAFLGYYFSTLFYFILGIHLLNKIINKEVNNSNKSLILFSVFCGTLIHYVITRFMMSHAVEFFLCSVLIYIFEKYFNKITTKVLFVLFFTYFLLSMTRPSTCIYSLCLLLVYLPRQKLKKKTLFQILIPSTIFSIFHVLISQKLYQTYSIFNNYQTNFSEQNYSEFEIISLINNLKYLPNLFFSSSMGIAWTIPVIIFGILSVVKNKKFFDDKNIFSKLFVFLYFFGAIIVLMVWEGRDVAFGQRLLIGLIPFCAIRTSEIINKQIYKKMLIMFTSISYLGYFYFYSSATLTLRKGTTLWNTVVGFTGEDYFKNLIYEFYNLENIFSSLSRNIISVNLFYYLPESYFEKIFNNIFSNQDLLNKLKNQISLYQSIDMPYFTTATFIFILFSSYFSYLITKKNTNN